MDANHFIILVFEVVVLIFSVMLHEIAHGAVAFGLGDQTAKRAGRLTLNPLKHIDPFGSVILPLMLLSVGVIFGGTPIIFGWAKPVPYNPFYLKNPKRDAGLIAAAGPLTNLAVAAVFGILLRILIASPLGMGAGDTSVPAALALFFSLIVLINISLAVFNCVPLPPLDGSNILFSFLPDETLRKVQPFFYQYGLTLLLIFIFFGFDMIRPLIEWLYTLIVGG